MTEDAATTPQAPVTVFCPQCGGVGMLDGHACGRCGGRAAMGFVAGAAVTWGEVLSAGLLAQRRLEEVVTTSINLALFAVGAIGLALGGAYLYVLGPTAQPWLSLWMGRHPWLLVFWLSLLADSYLAYRLVRNHHARPRWPVPKVASAPSTWEQFTALPKGAVVDLSRYATPAAHQALERAYSIAKVQTYTLVTPLHLMATLADDPTVAMLLVRLGVSFERLGAQIGRTLQEQPSVPAEQIRFDGPLQAVLFTAASEAWQAREPMIHPTDLLAALVVTPGVTADLLYDHKVDVDKVRNVVAWYRVVERARQRSRAWSLAGVGRPQSGMNRSMTAIATKVLDQFGVDLTASAAAHALAPCVGRDAEITALFRIVGSGNRRGAVLVGPRGVGKRAIINGLAQQMVGEDVPAVLADKRLVSVSIARLVAGVDAAGAQERLLRVVSEAARAGNVVLVFPDIVTMVGITPGGPASLDLAGTLAQVLSRSRVSILATVVDADYRKFMESSQLGSLLEKIEVAEPEGNAAIQILEVLAGHYEVEHSVVFTYDAIATAVHLSDRYLHDRSLPEKAIEVLEEGAVRAASRGAHSLVMADDIAAVVGEKTKIPLSEVTSTEGERLLHLEEKIHERMVDQEEAVTAVAAAIRRARVELRDERRPIANLLFLGPTGVGKTELAKTVAQVYFGASNRMVRLDMSEYQERTSVDRLLGMPGEGGYLTEQVRTNPFALLLADEFEKAHPDVVNLFLQLMDDGRLTDGAGRTVDFTSCIVICTSNVGSSAIQEQLAGGVAVSTIREYLLNTELPKRFRPELINRFDGVIVFKPLSLEDVRSIARLMLNDVAQNLQRRGIGFEITDAAVEELAVAGYDPKFGARPLRRVIQERIDDALAKVLLAGSLRRRDKIVVDVGGRLDIIKGASW